MPSITPQAAPSKRDSQETHSKQVFGCQTSWAPYACLVNVLLLVEVGPQEVLDDIVLMHPLHIHL